MKHFSFSDLSYEVDFFYQVYLILHNLSMIAWCLVKHILFHLHEKGLGREQMLCWSPLPEKYLGVSCKNINFETKCNYWVWKRDFFVPCVAMPSSGTFGNWIFVILDQYAFMWHTSLTATVDKDYCI